MSNVAKLKKRALEYEQQKKFDKALETYALVLAELDDHIDEADVALYNRVGDLLLRKGDVSEAVDHYEKAVDLYIDGGFLNNAIALCNKILRNAPGRNTVYYKLGKISAQKGFINDAKQNFVEYADRMQRAGNLEEAFRALKELADLCPGLDDIRLMLADQLVKKDRKSEAIEQLQTLYNKFAAEGRTKEARATVDRMKAIDGSLEPTAGATRPTPRANDLIFLDVDYDANGAGKKGSPPARPQPPEPVVNEIVLDPDLPLIDGAAAAAAADAIDGLTHGADLGSGRDDTPAEGIVSNVDTGLITGFLETVHPEATEEKGEHEGLAGLELTSHEEAAVVDDELPMLDLPDELTGAEEAMEPPTLERATSGLTLIMPDDLGPPAAPPPAPPKVDKPAKAEAPAAAKKEPPPAPKAEPPKAEAPPRKSEPVTDPKAKGRRSTPAVLPDLKGLEEDGVSIIDAVFAQGIGNAVDDLRERALHDPENWSLRRELAEALLENGERAAGLKALEEAMSGLERAGEFAGASSVAEELLRVDPNSVHYHQKRVEYAVRSNDRPRLVDAYLALAECLFRSGQLDKSKAVYGRVLELAPDDARAQSAMREAFGTREMSKAMIQEAAAAAIAADAASQSPVVANGAAAPPAAPPPPPPAAAPAPPPASRRKSDPAPARADAPPPPAEPPKRPVTPRRESFVNLSDWLRDDETEKSTRIVSANTETPSEQVGFAEMLTMFKQGVAANVEDTDHESHYDLGVAYKEMGLLDEAISEFQKALRGTEQRVRTYEALGQCFVEKRQYQIALTILARALSDKDTPDETLVGVLYLLGYASESLGQMDEALKYYERVFAQDIQFRDIGERLAATERKSR
jgi:tetratricopeptide (TPR) repeat protein